jgi:hypothetical protein
MADETPMNARIIEAFAPVRCPLEYRKNLKFILYTLSPLGLAVLRAHRSSPLHARMQWEPTWRERKLGGIRPPRKKLLSRYVAVDFFQM